MRDQWKLEWLNNAQWLESKNDETMRDQWKLEWLNNARES